jgi:hypothetical protein
MEVPLLYCKSKILLVLLPFLKVEMRAEDKMLYLKQDKSL